MTAKPPPLTLQPAQALAPGYPTRAERPSPPLSAATVAAATGGAATVLGGCFVLFPLLAPIFEHGPGQAAFGCIVTNPPVYLSEEDAAAIVRDELAAAGFTGLLTATDCRSFPITPLVHTEVCVMQDYEVREGAMVMDHYDLCSDEASFVLEIVTDQDYEHIVDQSLPPCPFQSESVRDLAGYVAYEALAGARTRYVGVLYDPMERGPDPDWWDTGDTGIDAYSKSEESLRAQVRDFIAWLRGHGG